jgi:exosome complex component RRP45
VHVFDHDGNLVDACCIAVLAALLHFRRPDIEVHGEDVTVFDIREREPVKLTIQHRPFCVSFSYYHSGQIMLQDATLLEEQCREGEVVISMNRFGEVCQIAKYGGTPVDGLSMLTCTNVALERVKTLDKMVMEALKEDEQRRDGGLMAELSAENERPTG